MGKEVEELQREMQKLVGEWIVAYRKIGDKLRELPANESLIDYLKYFDKTLNVIVEGFMLDYSIIDLIDCKTTGNPQMSFHILIRRYYDYEPGFYSQFPNRESYELVVKMIDDTIIYGRIFETLIKEIPASPDNK